MNCSNTYQYSGFARAFPVALNSSEKEKYFPAITLDSASHRRKHNRLQEQSFVLKTKIDTASLVRLNAMITWQAASPSPEQYVVLFHSHIRLDWDNAAQATLAIHRHQGSQRSLSRRAAEWHAGTIHSQCLRFGTQRLGWARGHVRFG